jgi:TnpA family transposase
LERFFFLDDADRERVARHRGDHHRLGFGLQLVTVRHVGRFLTDPLAVPGVVVDYVAEQVGVGDPSCVKRYTERRSTWFEHQTEIVEVYGYTSFASGKADLRRWVDDLAWTSGDGPRSLFYAAVAWLRQRRVLLPGVTTLIELVAEVRKAAEDRLHETLATPVTPAQARSLETVLEVVAGRRRSQLDLWRHGVRNPTGRGMVAALDRVAQIAGLGMRGVDIGAVPNRRVIELARYGLAAKAPKLARHPYRRRIATLLATVRWLQVTATDDALELFDVLMSNELIGRATKTVDQETLRRHVGEARDAQVLKRVVQVLLEAEDWGENVPLDLVWEEIVKAVGSKEKVRAVVERVEASAPPAGTDSQGAWRAGVVERYATVRPFVKVLCEVIEFGATADAAPVLTAMRDLPALLDAKATKRVPHGYLDARRVDVDLVPGGWWKSLVFTPGRPEGTVDRNGYVFCVLELFHARLKRRDIFAVVSDRWSDPRAKLLAGPAWDAAKGPALSALQLPETPEALLAGHAADLDAAWRAAAAGMIAGSDTTVDADGRLHLAKDDALQEPASLKDLRARVAAMLPRVDLPELILEVMAWHPGFARAYTSASGAATRLDDLHVSVAALLSAHSLNVGLGPVISGAPALTRDRLAHIDQHYLRPENHAAANSVLLDAPATALARAWGGGLLAAVDGIRFVVPVRTVDARPNPKFFARKRGVTWLNMISDQAVGLVAKVVSGTPKDTLHVVDLIYNPDGGPRPEVLITDQGSYSDIVFAILTLLGFDYRPVLADLPDAKLWRTDPGADYGALDKTARGRIDLEKIARHWPDILRVIASIHTREVSAHDVIRILQRDGRPTQLGEAFAAYGRIFKTLHVLTLTGDPDYRRTIKGMRNLQEGRHDLARHIFHGRRGELHQAYRAGMEDQLGALGLVLNCVTTWNTVYTDRALTQLRADGHPVADADVARLSAYQRRHINVQGHYPVVLPDLGGTYRTLRDPDHPDEQE